MAAKLMFKYDREADTLHIDTCAPYQEQESEELGDEVIARMNPTTGDVENLEVLFFSQRAIRVARARRPAPRRSTVAPPRGPIQQEGPCTA